MYRIFNYAALFARLSVVAGLLILTACNNSTGSLQSVPSTYSSYLNSIGYQLARSEVASPVSPLGADQAKELWQDNSGDAVYVFESEMPDGPIAFAFIVKNQPALIVSLAEISILDTVRKELSNSSLQVRRNFMLPLSVSLQEPLYFGTVGSRTILTASARYDVMVEGNVVSADASNRNTGVKIGRFQFEIE